MWPNDADGNAIRAALGPMLTEAGLHDRRPGRLHRRHQRLLRADRQVQGRGLRDLQHLPDPAGLRHLLAAGRPAGVRAEDRPDRQDRAVPLPGRGAGPIGVGLASARVLGAHLAVLLLADRGHVQAAGRRLQTGPRASSGTRASAPPCRCSTSAIAALKAAGDPKDKAAVVKAITTLKVDTMVGHLAWGKGPVPQRRHHPDHRRSVGRRPGQQPLQARLRDLRERQRPQGAGGRDPAAVRQISRGDLTRPRDLGPQRDDQRTSPDTRLTEPATMTTPNRYDSMACPSTVRRIRGWRSVVSDTW